MFYVKTSNLNILFPFAIHDENGEPMALFAYESEANKVCDYLNQSN